MIHELLCFEELIYRHGKLHCGALRLENRPLAKRIELLNDPMDAHVKDLEAGAIVY